MEEVDEFCVRVLGPGDRSREAAREAMAEAAEDRVQLLAAAVRACRARADPPEPAAQDPEPAAQDPGQDEGLAGAVARELAIATAQLPERQREVLALRESLRLAHDQIASIVGIEDAAVAPLLAHARLGLREQRRGGADAAGECSERERALRGIALRQDSEVRDAEDDTWLLEHLGSCPHCSRDHAAMLEASACYQAWRVPAAVQRSTLSDGERTAS